MNTSGKMKKRKTKNNIGNEESDKWMSESDEWEDDK